MIIYIYIYCRNFNCDHYQYGKVQGPWRQLTRLRAERNRLFKYYLHGKINIQRYEENTGHD